MRINGGVLDPSPTITRCLFVVTCRGKCFTSPRLLFRGSIPNPATCFLLTHGSPAPSAYLVCFRFRDPPPCSCRLPLPQKMRRGHVRANHRACGAYVLSMELFRKEMSWGGGGKEGAEVRTGQGSSLPSYTEPLHGSGIGPVCRHVGAVVGAGWFESGEATHRVVAEMKAAAGLLLACQERGRREGSRAPPLLFCFVDFCLVPVCLCVSLWIRFLGVVGRGSISGRG